MAGGCDSFAALALLKTMAEDAEMDEDALAEEAADNHMGPGVAVGAAGSAGSAASDWTPLQPQWPRPATGRCCSSGAVRSCRYQQRLIQRRRRGGDCSCNCNCITVLGSDTPTSKTPRLTSGPHLTRCARSLFVLKSVNTPLSRSCGSRAVVKPLCSCEMAD